MLQQQVMTREKLWEANDDDLSKQTFWNLFDESWLSELEDQKFNNFQCCVVSLSHENLVRN